MDLRVRFLLTIFLLLDFWDRNPSYPMTYSHVKRFFMTYNVLPYWLNKLYIEDSLIHTGKKIEIEKIQSASEFMILKYICV